MHGLPHQRECHHGAVPPGALAEGGEQARRDSQGNGNQQSSKIQLRGNPYLALEQICNAPPPVLVTLTKVSAQCVANVPRILDRNGVIQTLLGPYSVVGILPEILPQQNLHRIPWAEAAQGEGDKGHDHKEYRYPDQPADYISCHG